MLASEVIVRGSGNFIGFPDICWKALLDAGFVVMLFLVLHLLGYLLEIGSRRGAACPRKPLSLRNSLFAFSTLVTAQRGGCSSSFRRSTLRSALSIVERHDSMSDVCRSAQFSGVSVRYPHHCWSCARSGRE